MGALSKLSSIGWLALASYMFGTVWFVWRKPAHFELTLLIVEFLLLLPGLLLVLARFAGAISVPVPAPLRRTAVWLVLVFLILSASVAWTVKLPAFGGDESAYRFQARILATGRLASEAPPQNGLETRLYQQLYRFQHHVIHDGKWFGKYPLGWPLLLAGGVISHSEWLVNPLLTAILLFLTYRIALTVFGKREANLSIVLLVLSPLVLDQAAGFMSHVAAAIFIAGAFLQMLRWRQSARLAHLLGSAALCGCAFNVRPFTTACLVPIIAIGSFAPVRHSVRRIVLAMIAGGAVGLPFVIMFLLANRALTGSVFLSPYAVYGGVDLPPEITLNPISVARNVLTLTRWSFQATAFYGFVFAFVAASYAVLRERTERTAAWALSSIFLALVLGYMLATVPSNSPFGERYYFEGYWALMILAARGWVHFCRDLSLTWSGVSIASVMVLGVQGLHLGVYFHRLLEETSESRHIDRAVRSVATDRTLVLIDAPIGREKNYNDAVWRGATRFYMEDPGQSHRPLIGLPVERTRSVLISYDHSCHCARMTWQPGTRAQSSEADEKMRALGRTGRIHDDRDAHQAQRGPG